VSGFPSETGSDRLAHIEGWATTFATANDNRAAITGVHELGTDVLTLVEIAKAARVVGDMHESGEGFQWVGSEDDTEALDAICAALARLDSGAAE
jgi:hypothetical protein